MNEVQEPEATLDLSREPERERWAKALYGPVKGYFLRKKVPADRAAELTQDTFLRVFRSQEVFAGREQAKAWVFCIAENVFKNEVRALHAAKREGHEVALDNALPDFDALEAEASVESRREGDDPFWSLLCTERQELVDQALDELPSKMRTVLDLRLGQERTYQEIAVVLRIDIETVKSHLHQAQKRLRKILGKRLSPRDFGAVRDQR